MLALTGLPTHGAAGIKCWVNKEGVRECGNAVPPEYAQQGHEELNKRGMVINEQERARSAEELAAAAKEQQLQAERDAEQQRIEQQQSARDRVLLDTFTTEEDLLFARDGKVAALDARIDHTRQVVEKLQGTLASMQQDAARAELSGATVPQKLHDDIARVKRQINENRGFIELRLHEREELMAQFQADLDRYRELKQN